MHDHPGQQWERLAVVLDDEPLLEIRAGRQRNARVVGSLYNLAVAVVEKGYTHGRFRLS
jgi:hypothetical protein